MKLCSDSDELSLQHPGKSVYWTFHHHVSESGESGWLCRKLALPLTALPVQENHPPVYLPFTIHTEHHLWCFWLPHVWKFFPTPSNSLQHYWLGALQFHSIHYLPGESIRSHRLKVQSHKAAILHGRCQFLIMVCYLYFWSTTCKWGFPWPLPWIW